MAKGCPMAWVPLGARAGCQVCEGVSPRPVSFKEGRVVDDGGEQGREAPQQQGGEELGDDWVLQGARGVVSGRGRLVGSACFAYLPPPPLSLGRRVLRAPF